jgi:hypothetical protein
MLANTDKRQGFCRLLSSDLKQSPSPAVGPHCQPWKSIEDRPLYNIDLFVRVEFDSGQHTYIADFAVNSLNRPLLLTHLRCSGFPR